MPPQTLAKQLVLCVLILLCILPLRAQDADEIAYQEALRQIEYVRVNRLTVLRLYNMGLTRLPPEIGQLTQLERIDLLHNELTTLPPEIGQLTSLRHLYLSDNRLTALPPEIGQLTSLQGLYVDNNLLTGLPPEIGQLSKLEILHVYSNQLISLPSEIGQLFSLRELRANDNRLTSLPTETGQLIQLQRLYVSSLTFPPTEIQKQGTLAMLAYLREYEAMQMWQTLAAVAGGVGAIAGVLLAFRWRQRRGLGEKKKRA